MKPPTSSRYFTSGTAPGDPPPPLSRKPYRHIRKGILTSELTYADLSRCLPRTGGLVPVASASDGRVHRRSERARRQDAIRARGARALREDDAGRSRRRDAPARGARPLHLSAGACDPARRTVWQKAVGENL